MGEEEKLPASYHTFIYPFSYDKDGDKPNLYSYMECAVKEDSHSCWKEFDEKEEDFALRYNECQFFFPKAQKILFSDSEDEKEDAMMKRYVYRVKDGAELRIIKAGVKRQKPEEKKIKIDYYSLIVKRITLELFQELQVGLLSIETENRLYYKEEDIITINDLGRRIFPVCISPEDMTSVLTADRLKFRGRMTNDKTETGVAEIDFDNELSIKRSSAKTRELEVTFLENIIFSGQYNELKKSIHPILDDRMYVVCLMRKNQYRPIDKNELAEYRYLKDDQDSEQLYKFIFLEKGDSTCQNTVMRREKLEEHVYRRWTDYGTVHGVTEYSFVCVTGEAFGLKGMVINPFLTMYTSMVKLVLMQRAAITKMEEEAQAVSQKLKEKGSAKEIKNLWQKYVLFQNRLLIPQATFQEQGVELYDMLVKFLKIKEMNAYLEDELQNLFNYSQIEKGEEEKEQADNIDRKINFLTLIGTVLAVFSLMQDVYASFGINIFKEEPITRFLRIKAILYVFTAILVALLVFVAQKFNFLNQKKRGLFNFWLLFIILLAVALIIGFIVIEYRLKI